MFAIGINYLLGWAMAAADGARKEQAEWPPHPDRVFMAFAAAWFETGEDPAEGEALRWLETLDPPSIIASEHTERAATVSYVPVNDSSVSRRTPRQRELGRLRGAGLSLLPEHRSRQPRGFPVAIPHKPIVYIVWSEELGAHREALESLAAKVTHVGHSASLVQAWVTDNSDEVGTPTLEPTDHLAECHLRIFSPGRLDTLARLYNKASIMEYQDLTDQIEALRGKGNSRLVREERDRLRALVTDKFKDQEPVSLRPTASLWRGYDKPATQEEPDERGSIFSSNLVVLSITGSRVSLPTTLRLTQALRNALMKSCPQQPPPEWFSGHKPGGGATTIPHMALMPLPFVGRQHADGRVMGLALALPCELDQREAARSLSAFLYDSETGMPRKHKLFDGRWFECHIEIETRQMPPFNLRAPTWTRPSRAWASVTPVVFDRHFEGSDRWERAADSVKAACERIGLPRPREVLLHPTSMFEGVPLSREFPRMPRKSDGGLRRHAHAVLIFDEPVQGPILIGAGRFRGYGLCRPMDNRG